MKLASLRDRLAAPLEWIASQIKARPKGALVIFAILLVVVAWVF